MKSKLRNHLDGWFRRLRVGLLLSFDTIVLLNCREKSPRQEGAIFCLHGLGDLLLAGHAITRLAGHMRSRGLQAVLFVQPASVGFARRFFDMDRVEGIDRHRFTHRFGYRAAMLKTVAGRFVLAVQPTFNRMLRVEDCLVRATGAQERIGSAGHAPFISPQERWRGDRFYTQIIAARIASTHELERYAEFMAGMGQAIPSEPWRLRKNGQLPCDAPPHEPCSSGRESAPSKPKPCQSRLTSAATGQGFGTQKDVLENSLPKSPYLVVSPNASDRRRSWPLENFLRASRQVAMQHQLAVVLISGEKNHSPIRWPDDTGANPDLVDLCGQIPTEDLPELLARAELVMANDSGTYHLGVSLDRPTVAVGGSGLPARYFPYPNEATLPTKVLYRPVPCAGCNWRCIHTASRSETAWCLQQVSWPEVADAANELLFTIAHPPGEMR